MTSPSTALVFDSKERRWLAFSDPVETVEAREIGTVEDALQQAERAASQRGLWAVGWVSYEASPAFDPSLTVLPDSTFPKVWFGFFNAPIILSAIPDPTTYQPLKWSSAISQDEYGVAIRSIRERIARGDTYQVNYSFRLHSPAPEDPKRLFFEMVRAQAGDYSCFIETERFIVASASPELFFIKDGSSVRSRPMKGTRPRGRTPQEDEVISQSLQEASKDRAENTMIVDMVRNDLSRIAKRASVKVSSPLQVERYPNVFQMTREVEASTDSSIPEIFRALFPPASITGAPKSSTMRIIASLETTPRRVYTGSVGFISPDMRAHFNVAIRTALIDKETKMAEYGVGSGVVWDSRADDEYQECLDKASALTRTNIPNELFETILWDPRRGSRFFLLSEHMERLRDSASFYGIPCDTDLIGQKLAQLDETLATSSSPMRVRLRLSANGRISTEHTPLSPLPTPYTVSLATHPLRSSDRRLFHKTTDRAPYDEAKPSHAHSDDVILWNERGEITETRIANIVLDLDDGLVTPPVESGLLAGCYRRHLLERGEITERVITTAEMSRAKRVLLVNSLRGSWEARYLPCASTEELPPATTA